MRFPFVCLFVAATIAGGVCVVAEAQDAETGITYTVRFTGLEDTGFEKRMKSLSEAVENRKDLPASVVHLRRRLQRDAETFINLLHSEGYYSAGIETRVFRGDEEADAVFEVDLGPRYTFETIEIAPAEGSELPEDVLPAPDDLGLVKGDPAQADTVIAANRRLTSYLRNRGYPFARVADREVIVDRDIHTMDVRFLVDTGAQANFGELQVQGLNKVRPQVVEIEVPWEEGELYDAREMDRYRARLYDTQLFSVVRLEPGNVAGEDGQVPIALEVVERKHRTIALGADYYTDEGFGVLVDWELRNLWGLGHRFNFTTRVGQTRQEANLTLTLERFLQRQGQRLNIGLDGGHFEPEAYTADKVTLSAIFERDVTERLTLAGGIALRFSRVEQLGETERYELISFPLRLAYDHSNDDLNPTRGYRLMAETEPFFDFFGERTQFLKTRITGTYYQPLDENDRWVLAGRVTVGSITGDARDDVPADERFYAGGGGSIRGFPFQSVSPLEEGQEVGGLSLFEASVELRARFYEQFGAVAFVDAGSAFESNYPDFSEDIAVGAGVGVRYYSPIGPFRFDVGFPLTSRENVDDSYQLYLSIGQAF